MHLFPDVVVSAVLCVTVVRAQNDWRVTYTSNQICALKGSMMEISCVYRYPPRIEDKNTEVEEELWFSRGRDDAPVDLRTDPGYSGRVRYNCDGNT